MEPENVTSEMLEENNENNALPKQEVAEKIEVAPTPIEKRDKGQSYWNAILRMLPVLVIAGIVPFVVREGYRVYTDMLEYPWFGTQDEYYEFFLICKGTVLSWMLAAMALFAGYHTYKAKGKFPFAKIFIPLFVYLAFVVVSTFASIKPEFSWNGGYEQFESVWVLLCYGLTVYYVFAFAQTEKELRVVVDAVCFSATVVGLLGTLQGLGWDYLKQPFVQKLVTTDEFLNRVGGSFNIVFGDGTAYATMYNPNYLGVYGAFVVPFLAMLVLFDKSIWHRIWHCLNFVLMSAAMLFSGSRAGLISVGISLFIALIICCRPIIKWWFLTIPAMNFIVVLLLLVNAFNDNSIFGRMEGIFEKDPSPQRIMVDGEPVLQTGLTELYTAEDGVHICYNGRKATIAIYYSSDICAVYVLDEEGTQLGLDLNADNTGYTIDDSILKEVQILPEYIDAYPGFILKVYGEWEFIYFPESDEYKYFTAFDTLSDVNMAEAYGFEDRQNFFSSRGFIWSRTIPLLKKYIFVGSGPDTFILAYPQDDYLMKKVHGQENSVLTKPHSWYLQVGVQTGVISLIALLVFYFWYAIWSFRIYCLHKFKSLAEGFGISAFIGSIGYMISSLTNDSMVVTAPTFWVMMGVGIAANTMVTKMRKDVAAAEVPAAEATADIAETVTDVTEIVADIAEPEEVCAEEKETNEEIQND